MKFVSLFSGVGGFDLGLEAAGWQCVAQVEWDAHCQGVLARHWPDVPRWGDVSSVHGGDLPAADAVAFGSPCQDLSVAGQRVGLANGSRSSLFFEAVRIIKEMRDATSNTFPRFVIWENVAGALSSSGGRDFAAVLDKLAELGAMDIGWRVLDAQYFGVPQRRRRVFVVADLAGRCAGAIHTESESVCRADSSSDETRKDVADAASRCFDDPSTFMPGRNNEYVEGIETLRACNDCVGNDSETVVVGRQVVGPLLARDSRGPDVDGAVNGHVVLAMAFETNVVLPFVKIIRSGARCEDGTLPAEVWAERDVAPTLTVTDNASESRSTIIAISRVPDLSPAMLQVKPRRLTPVEYERLMGWPDDHTRWRADGTEVADTHRYRMCGNGVASPVAEWIADRINAALLAEEPSS